MLGKRKKVKDDIVAVSSPVPMEGRTVIGNQISIEGSIRGKEDLLIEGSVKGKVELAEHHLTIGPKGHVEAEIQADSVTISGKLNGNVKASGKVEITKEADFNGEIKAKSISVEDGAYLKAVIELEREPQKRDIPAVKLVDQPASDTGKNPVSMAAEEDKGK